MIALVGPGNARDHLHAFRLAAERGSTGFRFYLTGSNAVLARAPWTRRCAGMDMERVAQIAAAEGVTLAIVLDPVLLIAGALDCFRAAGLAVLGPDRSAAALEESKSKMKQVLAMAGVATPPVAFAASPNEVKGFVDAHWRGGRRFVLKVDHYLADANLRTILPEGPADAVEAARRQFAALAQAGLPQALLIEQRLEGVELSVHVLTDGRDYDLLPPVRDYKRVGDGDTGPNTHGAAALACGRGFATDLEARLRSEVVEPLLDAMRRLGISYPGMLYLGVMIVDGFPLVLEINVRPGNPEILAILGLLDSDLATLLEACAQGRLREARPVWRTTDYCGAVFALAAGYPERDQFDPIPIACLDDDWRTVPLFVEGVGMGDDDYVVIGGRVAAAVAVAGSIAEVRSKALAALATLEFAGKHHRTDLGANFDESLLKEVPAPGAQA